MIEHIRWLGHASFFIAEPARLYIDPWKLPPGAEQADLILISHSHYDHLSLEDVAKVRGEATEVVAPRDAAAQLGGRIQTVSPGSRLQVAGIEVEAFPAYNLQKPFHPRSDNHLGYILTLEGKRLYYAGDTDFIPEMAALTDIEVALLPVGGQYTMDAQEAARAANAFRPRLAVPYHWGDIVGTRRDAERFAELFEGETRILEVEKGP